MRFPRWTQNPNAWITIAQMIIKIGETIRDSIRSIRETENSPGTDLT